MIMMLLMFLFALLRAPTTDNQPIHIFSFLFWGAVEESLGQNDTERGVEETMNYF